MNEGSTVHTCLTRGIQHVAPFLLVQSGVVVDAGSFFFVHEI